MTGGAVYKWEAGLTFPEIEKLVEIADFFDTSTDALLGYEARDNSRAETVARIKKCMANKPCIARTFKIFGIIAILRNPHHIQCF